MHKKHNLAAQRVKKDIQELLSSKYTCKAATLQLEFPFGKQDPFHLELDLWVHEGPFAGGHFGFLIEIPDTFPFKAPAVCAAVPIWHPNIELNTGRVMLPLLVNDWSPVLSLNTVSFGLQLLMLEPNIDFAINQPAAALFQSDAKHFEYQVQQVLHGGCFFGIMFPPLFQPQTPSSQRIKRKFVTFEESDIKDGIQAISLQSDLGEPPSGFLGTKRSRSWNQSFEPVEDVYSESAGPEIFPTFVPGRLPLEQHNEEEDGDTVTFGHSTHANVLGSPLNLQDSSDDSWNDERGSHVPMICSNCTPQVTGWYTAAAVWPSYGPQGSLFHETEDSLREREVQVWNWDSST